MATYLKPYKEVVAEVAAKQTDLRANDPSNPLNNMVTIEVQQEVQEVCHFSEFYKTKYDCRGSPENYLEQYLDDLEKELR